MQPRTLPGWQAFLTGDVPFKLKLGIVLTLLVVSGSLYASSTSYIGTFFGALLGAIIFSSPNIKSEKGALWVRLGVIAFGTIIAVIFITLKHTQFGEFTVPSDQHWFGFIVFILLTLFANYWVLDKAKFKNAKGDDLLTPSINEATSSPHPLPLSWERKKLLVVLLVAGVFLVGYFKSHFPSLFGTPHDAAIQHLITQLRTTDRDTLPAIGLLRQLSYAQIVKIDKTETGATAHVEFIMPVSPFDFISPNYFGQEGETAIKRQYTQKSLVFVTYPGYLTLQKTRLGWSVTDQHNMYSLADITRTHNTNPSFFSPYHPQYTRSLEFAEVLSDTLYSKVFIFFLPFVAMLAFFLIFNAKTRPQYVKGILASAVVILLGFSPWLYSGVVFILP
jgi:hypothetical protein